MRRREFLRTVSSSAVGMAATGTVVCHAASGADIYLGGGAKVGEVSDRGAIVHVRLTATPAQDAAGLIPGREGQARVRYGLSEGLSDATITDWHVAEAKEDYSTQIKLQHLQPAKRYFYRVEVRSGVSADAQSSDLFSFVSAPAAQDRLRVKFHLTTCQDYRGEGTYVHMAAQQPDFCVSAGDTVYYDQKDMPRYRTVPQAYQAYQKMFGLPAMKEYYRDVGGYFMKDDHDYRFSDSDPSMKGKWVLKESAGEGAVFTETRNGRLLDVAWLSHEEGIRVFKTEFPMSERTHRTFRWGKGLQIWMTENRDYRSPNEIPDGPAKSIWGAEQKAWLKETLLASDADYRVIFSPTPIIGPDRVTKIDNHANPNGFWHEGQEFLDWLKDEHLERNTILMCGDRHWQYHSIDRRNGRTVHEFSCGPTCDEHVQEVPPMFNGVERPYAASRGGFLTVSYQPDRTLSFQFYSQAGEALYRKTIGP